MEIIWTNLRAKNKILSRHTISKEQYQHFFKSLDNCFIAGGDYNAKHTVWFSRLVSPKDGTQFKVMQKMKLSCITTGSPCYWPTDLNKLPGLIDFCITKGISSNLCILKKLIGPCLEMKLPTQLMCTWNCYQMQHFCNPNNFKKIKFSLNFFGIYM